MTTLLTIPGAIGGALWVLADVGSALKTSGPFLGPTIYTETDVFRGRLNILGFVGGAIGSLFAAAGAIVISLMWLDIANSVKNSRFVKRNMLQAYRRYIYAFLATAGITAVGAGIFQRVFENSNILGFVIAPFAFIIAITYFLGALRFTQVLNESRKNNIAAVRRPSVSRGSYRVSASVNSSPKLGLGAANKKRSSFFASIRKTSKDEVKVDLAALEERQGSYSAQQSSQNDRLRGVILVVRNTTLLVGFSLLLTFVSSLSYSVLDLTSERRRDRSALIRYNTPDNVNSAVKILYFLQICALTLLVFVITKYLYGNITRTKESSRSPSL
eukprot:CAMPEP_0184057376 /NCGR_PEP_ID=MMETSP0956-20121227/8439_1 /TAXON_ID=627963 /ORGANISM="Aplanochytrium sp, Strain PBS07" /LENGTH=328 /DNA_ID=CAMNT_0026351787 /DNA_START=183 /DNA_END=1169 /DNA_ORIENTATION=-